jgi:prepilin-type N-terminal cleavage/methylation domain-containing protein
MMQQRQRGFTLVELMVAMVIGTIIILGAGQLFLTTFQTFQNVDKISRKQENLVFIAQRITREIRQYGPGRYTLECESELVQEKNQCTCTVADTDEGNQPLVSFRKDLVSDDLSDCSVEEHELGEPVPDNGALYRVSLPIENNGEPIVFHIMNRPEVYKWFAEAPVSQEGKGDVVIAGGALSGADNILVAESTANSNLGLASVPSPQQGASHDFYTDYINSFSKLENVVATCRADEIMNSSRDAFYCNGNINNLNVAKLSGKVIVAENGISMSQNNNESVFDVAIVAGGVVNFNGSGNSNALFRGLIWSGGSANISVSGVSFVGSIISSGSVAFNNVSGINADFSVWDLLSIYGYEFSMRRQLERLSENINFGDE